MIGLLRFVFASLVWPFTSQARLHATGRDFAPQKPLAAWAKQLGLGDDLRTLHAILEDESEPTRSSPARLQQRRDVARPHGCEMQAERMRPDHRRPLIDSSVEEKRVRFGRRIPRRMRRCRIPRSRRSAAGLHPRVRWGRSISFLESGCRCDYGVTRSLNQSSQSGAITRLWAT